MRALTHTHAHTQQGANNCVLLMEFHSKHFNVPSVLILLLPRNVSLRSGINKTNNNSDFLNKLIQTKMRERERERASARTRER